LSHAGMMVGRVGWGSVINSNTRDGLVRQGRGAQVAVDERRAAGAAPQAGQDWSAQYLNFLTSLAKTSSQPLQLVHLKRCAPGLL
jgi:hypothetical protein